MDERTKRLNVALESLVVASRKAALSWGEHMALNNAALELKSYIDGKDKQNEGTPDSGSVGGE
jgi:hypothetical protein